MLQKTYKYALDNFKIRSIKLHYNMPKNMIEICNITILIPYSIGHKINFYPTLQLLLLKEKSMQMHVHPPFNY